MTNHLNLSPDRAHKRLRAYLFFFYSLAALLIVLFPAAAIWGLNGAVAVLALAILITSLVFLFKEL